MAVELPIELEHRAVGYLVDAMGYDRGGLVEVSIDGNEWLAHILGQLLIERLLGLGLDVQLHGLLPGRGQRLDDPTTL